MKTATPLGGPYTHEKVSVGRTMSLVMFALLPATLFGFYLFGWPALILFTVTVLAAAISEIVCLLIAGKPVKTYLFDGSAVLTGWLLAMSLPPWAPWWIGLVGSVIAIVIGKQVFGGIGQNLFNPAMVARVALLISFPFEMTTWVGPHPIFSAQSPDFEHALQIIFGHASQVDAVSSATVLGHIKTELSRNVPLSESLGTTYDVFTSALGITSGSMGETASLLVLVGGLFLLFMRIISWHIPFSMIITIALVASVFNWVDPERYAGAGVHLFSGATMLGAFFIATDLVTSPVTRLGQVVFGAGCGLLVFTIRTWAGYPEGMGFAVVLMNALTPLIDHYIRPRIYGRDRKGQPAKLQQSMSGDK